MVKGIQKVLLAGDSISFGYGPRVKKILEGIFYVDNLPENGGPSANLLAHIDEWMINPNFDIIHFNCGIHDLLVYNVPLKLYESNLEKIINRLSDETSAILVWGMTTPVIGNQNVQLYNNVARKVMTKHKFPIDNLYKVIEKGGKEKCIAEDGVI